MKAAVWHGRSDVRIEGVDDPPAPPQGQVQVEVAWCGICGTDLHEYTSGPVYIPVEKPHPLTGVRAPVIIGHEMSGRVTRVGDGMKDFKAGDRVAVCPIIGCGACRWCLSGSMAQCDKVAFLGTSWTGGALAAKVNLNAYQCYHIPESMSYETGALVEPFSSVVRAVRQHAPGPDDKVAVVGAGPIGLMAIMTARILGVKSVTAVEMEGQRIDAALAAGAEEVINPATENAEDRAHELTGGQGFDLVIECVGKPATVFLAARIARTRGHLTIMGVFDKPAALDMFDLVFREKSVSGSMSGYGMYKEAIEMMMHPLFRTDLLITDRIALDELVDKGIHQLIEHRASVIKILVQTS